MSTPPFEFETALKELEEITAWFESTDINLDTGLAKFERGLELATALKSHLTTVENRVEKIRQRFTAAGDQPISEPAVPDSVPTDQTGLFGA